MKTGLTTNLDSLLKHQLIKQKESLMEAWKRREKVFMDQLLVKRVSYLLTISICLKKKNMELSHQSNYLDNGWTMVDGMISIFQKEISENLSMLDLLGQWDLQVVAETLFQIDIFAILMFYTFNHTKMRV